jgi:ArsR family transcriptional regulator, arsenate/arsenite/antimonite-responsive transcriptional repressor
VAPMDLPLAKPKVVAQPRNLTLDVLRALAHPLRLELIAHIAARGPICVCHLEDSLPHTQAQISKHLGILRRAGLVESRREGRWVYYTIDEEALAAAGDFLADLRQSLRRPHLADSCEEEAG